MMQNSLVGGGGGGGWWGKKGKKKGGKLHKRGKKALKMHLFFVINSAPPVANLFVGGKMHLRRGERGWG